MVWPPKGNPIASSSERTATCTYSPALPSQQSSTSTSRRSAGSLLQASSSRPLRSVGSLSAARWNNSSICAQRSGFNWHLSTLHFVEKPRFRHPQVAPHGNGGDRQRLRDLIHGEPAEIAELNGLAFPRVELLKRHEAIVEGHKVSTPLGLKAHRLFQ